jgi:hypothetical protein
VVIEFNRGLCYDISQFVCICGLGLPGPTYIHSVVLFTKPGVTRRDSSNHLFFTSQNALMPSVDNQNCPFYEVVKMWNGPHHHIPLIEMVKKHIWNV